MASSGAEIEFVEQLKEAGNLLLSPPSDIQELIAILDKVESLLAMVEQSPSKSVGAALLPSMMALVANEVLRHQDTAVRMAVASCMSEISRISAPDAPYNDEEMREVFKLIVSAFEKLSDVSGPFYAKAVNCLDILTKVRTSLLMLDLKCDASVIKMFQTFLKVIRSEHPKDIFSAMEKTMTLVIDESEDVSWDLLSTLLASIRKENQDVSSTSRKLGEEVIAICAAKLKPYLMEAVQSRGIVLDEYADVVPTICKKGDGTLQHGHHNGTKEHMRKMISKAAAKSEETPKRVVKRKHSAGKNMKLTSKAAVESSNRDGNSSEETRKTEVKRKNTTEKEVASETSAVDEQLVGSRVRVWWPLDKMFYEGAVDSYDNIKKKHKIVYADGEVEILNLKRQRWELIGSAEEGQETGVVKPDASSDALQKEPAKEVKQKSTSRRKSYASRSKAKTRKSGDNSADGAKLD